MERRHALVLGASGLAGWAMVDQLLAGYPAPQTFSTLTAITNRPLDRKKCLWREAPAGMNFQLVSGIDLTQGPPDEFAARLNARVPSLAGVTHVYYCAFKQDDDPDREKELNCRMLDRIVGALDRCSPGLEFVSFTSGTRIYGINVPGGMHKAPLHESMTEHPAASFRQKVHYYGFDDILAKASADALGKGRNWTWNSVIPDAIIGFAPAGSTFSLTAHWANYLALHALLYGPNTEVPFPGNEEGYHAKFSGVSSSALARFAIYTSMHPDVCGNGQTFNIADSSEPTTMATLWPQLCAYFGLRGVKPSGEQGEVSVSEFNSRHAHVLAEHGLSANTVFKAPWLDVYGYSFTFDRQLDISRARGVGFAEEGNHANSWLQAFDRFREAGMLPAKP